MEMSKEKICYILQFYFDKGKTASYAATKVNNTYGPRTVSNSEAHGWYKRFRSGNFNVEDDEQTGDPITDGDEQTINRRLVVEKIEDYRHTSIKMIAEALRLTGATIHKHAKGAGFKKIHDFWVPHEMSQETVTERISICKSLLQRHEKCSFLHRIVAGDTKWIKYKILKQQEPCSEVGEPAQAVAQPELTAQKALLCIWWDLKGLIHYELLPADQTVNQDLYFQQLTRLKAAVEQKRPWMVNEQGVLYHQDHAKIHTSDMTCQKIRDFQWEFLPHPPHSPDIAPVDYQMFRTMQGQLSNVRLTSREACETWIANFLTNNNETYFNGGIVYLPRKWQRVIEKNGAYLKL